ncbi:MAG: depupylase/deamidase Dop [Acidimicrobiales bacterium]
MAIVKVCGTETEFGIQVTGAGGESNPIAASSVLINAYVSGLARRVGWDFEDESPEQDARGFTREGDMAPEVETHLVNAVLTNGARFYVDHAHPEYSGPECANPLEAVLYDKAGEEILIRSMAAAAKMCEPGQQFVIYKNNSDRKGNSYGAHENYLMDRTVPFDQVVRHITSHFVTRQIYTGAGKVGSEAGFGGGRGHGPRPGSRGNGPDEAPTFQLTQRADFFEEAVGLETTLKRPIVNTRDEPHSDSSKYRRLHVIVGDANLAQVAIWLKIGVTALILAMIEDDFTTARDLGLADPVEAMHQVSYDLTLRRPLDLAEGGTITALELQWELFDLSRKYAEEIGLDAIGGDVDGRRLLDRWEAVLGGLETDPDSLADQLDWVAKYRLIDAYRERHELEWSDHRLAAMDLQYHDLRPSKSLFARLGTETLFSTEEISKAVTEPPRDTRAYFRGKCLQRWSSYVSAANWDSMVFDLGTDPLRRVPMMEPLKGTAAHVDKLLEECSTPAELLDRLGS